MAGKVHLTPGEINALWHLTRWVGRSFWHLTTWAQCVIAGAPGLAGAVGLSRWKGIPMATDAEVARWNRRAARGRRRD